MNYLTDTHKEEQNQAKLAWSMSALRDELDILTGRKPLYSGTTRGDVIGTMRINLRNVTELFDHIK